MKQADTPAGHWSAGCHVIDAEILSHPVIGYVRHPFEFLFDECSLLRSAEVSAFYVDGESVLPFLFFRETCDHLP